MKDISCERYFNNACSVAPQPWNEISEVFITYKCNLYVTLPKMSCFRKKITRKGLKYFYKIILNHISFVTEY